MSWLARSITDSLRIDDDGGGENNAPPNPRQSEHTENEEEDEEDEDEKEEDEDRIGRGVREDLSEFTETLTRQLWGVASFLAPPPPPAPPPRHRVQRPIAYRNRWDPSSDQSGSGDDSDGETSDSVGISNQSEFLPFEREDPVGEAVGVTEEVLAFAMNIAHHPETWLDFPLEEEVDIDGFDMSDAQHDHVLAIQRLAPWLAALRIELCPAHMSEGYFWKIYFVLLHSRLNKQDAELLSTPQVRSARAMWMQELQKRTDKETHQFEGTSYIKESFNSWHESYDHGSYDDDPGNMSFRTFAFEPATYSVTTEIETEKHPILSTGIQIVDKSVIEEEPVAKTEDKDLVPRSSFKAPVQNYEDDDDDDDWLKEDSELDMYSGTTVLLGTDEDVSFSDLEDDDDSTMPVKSKTVAIGLDKSTRNTRG